MTGPAAGSQTVFLRIVLVNSGDFVHAYATRVPSVGEYITPSDEAFPDEGDGVTLLVVRVIHQLRPSRDYFVEEDAILWVEKTSG
jgi:hypothetical protein